jgi:hypothetical protein
VRYGLRQDWYEEIRRGPDQSEKPDGDLLEYDLALSLLPQGKISGTAFASRLDTRVPRAFQPSLDRTRERYGGTLLFNDAKLPMRLSFEHVWDDLTSRTDELRDDEKRGDDTLRYEATWQIARNHAVTFNYEYNDRTEQYSGSRTRYDTYRNYATLNHVLRFGEDNRSSWENLLRLQDETGDLARDQYEASSRLRLQHTKELATNWGLQYYRDAFQELETETWRGEGGVTWQPLPELITTGQFWGYQQQADENADFCELGALLNASYARDNALGRFSANASYNHTSTDTRNGDRRGIVIGESVTLRDPLLAFLLQPDIDWETIVVTDATRSRTYLPGRDYAKIRVGRYTALRRVATGQIPDQATVLVSYTYRLAEDLDIQRDRFDVRLQQDFKFGLSTYYAAALQDESVDPSEYVPWRDRNINRQRVGATFRRKRWSIGGEYEYNDDSIDPYQALHGNGDWVVWQAARHQLDAKIVGSQFWFDGAEGLEARDTFLLDLGASYRYLLAQNLEATASAMYRYEDDTLYGTTNGVDLTAALDWRIGLFALRFEAEYDLLDLETSRDNSFAFWLKLKREFPIVNKGAR